MKPLKTLALTTLLLILCSAAAIAQSSQNSIPVSELKTVSSEQAISILTTDVSSARAFIKTNNERIGFLETELTLEKENSQSFSRSYEAAKSEISALKTANLALGKAIDSYLAAIALLESERDKQKKRAGKWKKRTFQVAAILAASILTKVLQ